MKFSFRFRLTFWYATIVTLSLSGFSFFNYATTSQKLSENLDTSVLRVAQSLEAIIRQKQREVNQPLRPATARKDATQNTNDTYLEFFRQETLRKICSYTADQTASVGCACAESRRGKTGPTNLRSVS